ncbi:appetite-regulating hormone [Dromiciops gliroides]|uniref:appetite-regulating hormone n=1 Tax=Dromiciops gliroides TaxID=33562 RepID=UPI001CC4194C|nr:appetite-regulating hormone [Dromiciops gliroides]
MRGAESTRCLGPRPLPSEQSYAGEHRQSLGQGGKEVLSCLLSLFRYQLLPVPSEKMFPKAAICSLLLLSVLWIDVALAGSSFLSPEHAKTQRKESKKPPVKLVPRDMEDASSQPEEIEKGLEIQFNAPFDIGIKVAEAQYQQYGQALEKVLKEILSEENQGHTVEN